MDLCLAGCEMAEHLAMAAAAHEWRPTKPVVTVLSSYWAMHPKPSRAVREMWALHDRLSCCRMIVDSGLFTMMFGAGKSNVYSLEDLKLYTRAYLTYLRELSFGGVAVEMDVHKVLGLVALEELRTLCADLWPVERMIYVWHIEEGIDGLRALVDRYPYVALSIPELRIIASRTKQNLMALVTNLMTTIRTEPKGNAVRIHLLGCTQLELMANGMYDTVDSTSWMYGFRYGDFQAYDRGRMLKVEVGKQLAFGGAAAASDELAGAIDAYRAFCNRHLDGRHVNLARGGIGVMGIAQYMRAERAINERFYTTRARRYDPWAGGT